MTTVYRATSRAAVSGRPGSGDLVRGAVSIGHRCTGPAMDTTPQRYASVATVGPSQRAAVCLADSSSSTYVSQKCGSRSPLEVLRAMSNRDITLMIDLCLAKRVPKE